MKALEKRVDDIEQSVAQRTKKISDVDSRKIKEIGRWLLDGVQRPVGRDDNKEVHPFGFEVSAPSIPVQDERPDVAEQQPTDMPIPDRPLPSEQASVEIRQEDNRVDIIFTITPDDRERLKVAAKEREITEEELLKLFIMNVDLFVPFPPKTAGHIRRASVGQRRAAHRLVEQVLRKGFSRFDWH